MGAANIGNKQGTQTKLEESPAKAMPTVGIVVPTLGERASWLAQTLDSLERQRGVRLRVVIVAPDTAIVRAAAARYGYELIISEPSGLSAAINLGLDHLVNDCDYVNWLGDDDLLAPDSLRVMTAALDRHSGASFAYGRTRYIDSDGNAIYLSRPTKWAPLYMRYGRDYVPQPGALIRAHALIRRPIIDERLKNAMDLEMFLWLSLAGTDSWVYVRREVSAYRLHPTAITATKGTADESEEVRRRYQSDHAKRLMVSIRPFRRFAERTVDWISWRISKPRVPTINGAPYTRVRLK